MQTVWSESWSLVELRRSSHALTQRRCETYSSDALKPTLASLNKWNARVQTVQFNKGIHLHRVQMTWNDMKWHEMTWNDMKWHEMTWNDMNWHEMTWNNVTWQTQMINDITCFNPSSAQACIVKMPATTSGQSSARCRAFCQWLPRLPNSFTSHEKLKCSSKAKVGTRGCKLCRGQLLPILKLAKSLSPCHDCHVD